MAEHDNSYKLLISHPEMALTANGTDEVLG